MPAATPTPAPAPTPNPAQETRDLLVGGKLVREKGKLFLRLDVSKLHDWLRHIGVEVDAANKRFTGAPGSRVDVIDTSEHVISPKALCSVAYKNDTNTNQPMPGLLEFDLMRHYTTPPTNEALDVIAASVRDAAYAVVAHYQPVEITISVVGKKAR